MASPVKRDIFFDMGNASSKSFRNNASFIYPEYPITDGSVSMKKINVLLADGNRLFIESLRIVILENPEYSVVGTVLSGVDAIKAIAELAPDVTVVGQILPDISILQVVKELRRNSKSTKFLF